MEALKEYTGVITAAVTVFAALGALGLWAINVQVTPELHRLDGRIENMEALKTLKEYAGVIDGGCRTGRLSTSRLPPSSTASSTPT